MTRAGDHRSRLLPRLVAGVVLALGVLAGCGQHTTAGEAAPEVRSALTKVEKAVAAHDYAVARRALNVLTQHTVAARASGTLSSEQADRILAAAARVKTDLPAATPTPSTSPSEDTGGSESGDDDGPGKSEEHKKDNKNKNKHD